MNNFKFISTDIEYNQWKTDVGSESNGLENMFYHTLKNELNNMKTINDQEFYSMLSNCEIDLCSRVEYFTVIPIKDNDNKFAVWFSTNNVVDDRKFKIGINHNNETKDIELELKTNQTYYNVIDYDGGEYEFNLYENDKLIKVIKVNSDYIQNKIKNNGELIIK